MRSQLLSEPCSANHAGAVPLGSRARCRDDSGRRTHRASLLKTFTAINRSPLCRFEGNRRFLPTLRAGRLCFRSLKSRHLTGRIRAFCLAGFAPLGFIFETLIGKKQLFAGGKHKFRTTFRALQDLIPVLHDWLPRPHAGCEVGRQFWAEHLVRHHASRSSRLDYWFGA